MNSCRAAGRMFEEPFCARRGWVVVVGLAHRSEGITGTLRGHSGITMGFGWARNVCGCGRITQRLPWSELYQLMAPSARC